MFEARRWGDISSLKYGKALAGYRELKTGSVPVFGTNGPVGFTAAAQVDGPGVIIGRKGAYRGVHYSSEPFWVIDTAFYLVPHAGIDTKWAYYALQLADINGLDSGSAIPSTTRDGFYSLRVLLPSLRDQTAIAEVLSALDDKIAVNTRLLESLDGLTSVLFQSLLATTSSIALSATADFVNGKAFTKGASGTGRVVARIAELNSGIGGSTVYSDAEVEDQFVAYPGTLLFAWSGSLTMHRWFRAPAIINQHIFKVIPKDGYPMWLVHELLRGKLEFFKSTAADKATTMGHIQRKHLDELVSIPGQHEIDSYSVLMTSLWDRALVAERENESLAATRDVLLPQLMSGKLRVRDAETSLAGVL